MHLGLLPVFSFHLVFYLYCSGGEYMFEKTEKKTKSLCCIGTILLLIFLIFIRAVQNASFNDLLLGVGFLVFLVVCGMIFGFFDPIIWKRPEIQDTFYRTEHKLNEFAYEGINTYSISNRLKNSEETMDLNELRFVSKATEDMSLNLKDYNLLLERFTQLINQNKDLVDKHEDLSEDAKKILNKFQNVKSNLTIPGIKDIENDITKFTKKLDEIKKLIQEGYR
jgi:hypothetical protein